MIVVLEFLMVVRPWLSDGDLMWYWNHQFIGDRVYHEGHGSEPYWAALAG
jgi:hypothetical protein